MVSRLLRIGCLIFALSASLAAFQPAKLGGKWFAAFKITGAKTGKAITVKMTLELKPRGKTLAGTLVNYVGKREIKHDIQEGKIDGASISFLEIAQAQQGEQTIEWTGALEGDTLNMRRALKGGRRKQTIVFKR